MINLVIFTLSKLKRPEPPQISVKAMGAMMGKCYSFVK